MMKSCLTGLSVPGRIAGLMVLALITHTSQVAAGGCNCSACAGQAAGPVCGDVGYQLVERTIQVPTMVTERRVIHVTECRTDVRERIVNVQKVIPEVKQVRDVYTVMVPQIQKRVEKFHVSVPVWREVVQNITVQVPTQELRKGVRHVCRQVQVQEMRTVCRDLGHWDEVLVDVVHQQSSGCGSGAPVACGRGRRWLRGCGGCGGCGNCGGGDGSGCGSAGYDAGCGPAVSQQIQRVWKPEIVNEQVPVMVWRNQMVEEPYEYHVTVYRPEARQQKTKVCEYVSQERQREVQFTVCVPQQRESMRNVTTYRTVTEPQVQRFTVQVPVQVQKEISVQVCHLVPRTVTYRVPVGGYSDCGSTSGGWGSGGCGVAGCRRCCR